jgi:quercetin dioxygenase-like cupin family protein
MISRLSQVGLALAIGSAAFGLPNSGQAVELNPAAVTFKTPDQFKWRNPNMQPPNNALLLGDPNKAGEIYMQINFFVPGRFGNPHHHPNERYIVVLQDAPWRGTGTVVDPAKATRVPKGTFMIDHAGKVHWDGTKDEGGAYLIFGIGPSTQTEVPKGTGAWVGEPSAVTIKQPNEIQWKDNGNNRSVTLAGDPEKEGSVYVQMLTWKKGNFSRPHFHPNDRFFYVLEGTWWVGTGNKFDPANLTVPMKAGTFVTHHAKGVHWDGAKDNEDATILVVGIGPATTTRVPEAN